MLLINSIKTLFEYFNFQLSELSITCMEYKEDLASYFIVFQ
jgi:hypothetical protein